MIGRSIYNSAVQKSAFPPYVLTQYQVAMSKPGAMTAGLNYYRATARRGGYGYKGTGASSQTTIATPTLLIWGEQDGLFPVSIAHEFHAGIPNADLVLLPHAAHMPQTQATRKVAQIIIRDAGMG